MNIEDFKNYENNRVNKIVWSRRDGKVTKKSVNALVVDDVKMFDSKKDKK